MSCTRNSTCCVAQLVDGPPIQPSELPAIASVVLIYAVCDRLCLVSPDDQCAPSVSPDVLNLGVASFEQSAATCAEAARKDRATRFRRVPQRQHEINWCGAPARELRADCYHIRWQSASSLPQRRFLLWQVSRRPYFALMFNCLSCEQIHPAGLLRTSERALSANLCHHRQWCVVADLILVR